jgi:predicted secreted protein
MLVGLDEVLQEIHRLRQICHSGSGQMRIGGEATSQIANCEKALDTRSRGLASGVRRLYQAICLKTLRGVEDAF